MRTRNTLLCIASFIFIYGFLEVCSTYFFSSTTLDSYWVYSNDKTFLFDPVSGYRMSREPTRRARITNGIIEYIGLYQGNNRGFADRDNFTFERTVSADRLPRYGVFGDSFSHAHFNIHNWPDYAEDLLYDAGRPMQLLNFSLDGQGLANWWSILKGEIERQNYQLDGLIFAVYEENLFRPFTMIHTENHRLYLGRVPFWNPEQYPKSFEQSVRYMPDIRNWFIFDEQGFFRALTGAWKPKVEREWFILGRAKQLFAKVVPPKTPAAATLPEGCGPETNEPWRQRMIGEIAESVRQHRWKALVIFIPGRDSLLAHAQENLAVDSHNKAETRRFAKAIGAEFHDSTILYKGMSDEEIRNHFLPYDGHWNLKGSDLFGRFVADIVARPAR